MKLFAFAGIAIAFIVFLLLIQHRMIYYPRQYDTSYSRSADRFTELHYVTGSGPQVAFYLPPASGDLPVRLWFVFGGNASLALDWHDLVTGYPDKEAGFVLIDYPGFGRCEGKASPETILTSTEQALATLADYLKVKPDVIEGRLHVLGHSLGAAAGLLFAANHEVRKLVLVSPFTSLRDMAIRVVGMPLNYLVTGNFDNRARIQELLARQTPPKITIIHGDQDEVVPVAMGRKLHQIRPDHIQYIEIENADHNYILAMAEARIYESMIRE